MLVVYEFHYGPVEHGKHQHTYKEMKTENTDGAIFPSYQGQDQTTGSLVHTSVKGHLARKRTKRVDCCMLADRYSHLQ